MNLTFKAVTISFIVALASCNNETNRSGNPVFEKFSPASREYKDELAKKLQSNPAEFHYTFNCLVEQEGKEYLDIEVEGDDFTAKGLVLVNNWTKMEAIKKTKGQGYSGAELRGLKLKVEENPSGANLVYDDVEKIVVEKIVD
jgi:hypothetical protein